VVILHDCSGLGPRSSGAPWRWSSELTRRGYVTIWPDSFAPRGKPAGVCTDTSLPRVTPDQRAADAYSALAHLRSLGFVDGRRVALMGGSHGGSSTLAAIVDTPENAGRANPGFVAVIALYPNCGRTMGDWSVKRSMGWGGPVGLCGRVQAAGTAVDPDRRTGRLDASGAVPQAGSRSAGGRTPGRGRDLPRRASFVR
jgi:dienelactone hydrolase